MLVIYVITAVIGFIIYTAIKIKLEDWLENTRMSRLSLKRRQLTDGMSECSNVPPRRINDIVEISSDESDISQEYKIVESDSEPIDSQMQNKVYDEETLNQFQKSTDSIQSDEEVAESSHDINSKPKVSMFNWYQRKLNLSKNETKKRSNSTFPDEYDQQSTSIQQGYENKKYRNNHASIPPSKSKPNDIMEEAAPEVGIQHEQMISGIKVKLPVKPYSCQIAVMSKLIQGCTKMENCLLESPTGTGKTLALLCGVLAWHDHHVGERECTAGPRLALVMTACPCGPARARHAPFSSYNSLAPLNPPLSRSSTEVEWFVSTPYEQVETGLAMEKGPLCGPGETWRVAIIIGERGIIYCVPGNDDLVVAVNRLCASACNSTTPEYALL
ncbi:Fanconi anemia group J protein [Eufriesea mexicana]|uniref:Fanconi anemia group J protein n=1 Tax=Eufriesea mexicana TaxID=516756 RepID=A0A310SCR0_9HYME|nr:Fanconi anemia group J protein [Eufriesea mexicana]